MKIITYITQITKNKIDIKHKAMGNIYNVSGREGWGRGMERGSVKSNYVNL